MNTGARWLFRGLCLIKIKSSLTTVRDFVTQIVLEIFQKQIICLFCGRTLNLCNTHVFGDNIVSVYDYTAICLYLRVHYVSHYVSIY